MIRCGWCGERIEQFNIDNEWLLVDGDGFNDDECSASPTYLHQPEE